MLRSEKNRKYFRSIYLTEKGEPILPRWTMDDYEKIFSLKPHETERIEKQSSEYHDILENAYNTIKNINKKAASIIKQLLDNEKANVEALKQAKIDDTELFIQFKNEYNKYKVEQDKHYKSWKERFYEEFFGGSHKNKGGSYKYKTRSYKYFTGQYNSFEELKKEYRKLSRKYHPDMSTGSKEQFQEMNEEYESLKNKFTA